MYVNLYKINKISNPTEYDYGLTSCEGAMKAYSKNFVIKSVFRFAGIAAQLHYV